MAASPFVYEMEGATGGGAAAGHGAAGRVKMPFGKGGAALTKSREGGTAGGKGGGKGSGKGSGRDAPPEQAGSIFGSGGKGQGPGGRSENKKGVPGHKSMTWGGAKRGR